MALWSAAVFTAAWSQTATFWGQCHPLGEQSGGARLVVALWCTSVLKTHSVWHTHPGSRQRRQPLDGRTQSAWGFELLPKLLQRRCIAQATAPIAPLMRFGGWRQRVLVCCARCCRATSNITSCCAVSMSPTCTAPRACPFPSVNRVCPTFVLGDTVLPHTRTVELPPPPPQISEICNTSPRAQRQQSGRAQVLGDHVGQHSVLALRLRA